GRRKLLYSDYQLRTKAFHPAGRSAFSLIRHRTGTAILRDRKEISKMAHSKEDIIRRVKEEDIEFIRLQFTDIFGQLKNVAITASQIEKAVNNQCMFDGSSIEGFVRIDESDQY